MMKTKINFLKLARAAFLLIATGAILLGGSPVARADSDGCLSRATKRQLIRAQLATARYHNINRAIADGYVDINVFIPNMGYHYLKSGILDGTFDPEKPELLVYADFGNGHRRLVAVEYAVPTALTDTPPEGFTGDDDMWHRNDEFGLWTLHAWIWYHNPDVVFDELNPRVP
jgi:hypothetical protein